MFFTFNLFQNKEDWFTATRRRANSPERTIQGQNQFQGGYNPQQQYHYPPVQYPGQQYYQNYYPGQYNAGNCQPYENQYGYNQGYNQPQNYPYRPIQQPVFPQPPPPPPPTRRDHPPTDPNYRRESFSVYSSNNKRAKSNTTRCDTDEIEPPRRHSSPRRPHRDYEPHSPRNQRSEYEPLSPRFKAREENKVHKRKHPSRKYNKSYSDDELSDYDNNLSHSVASEASIESVISLMNRSYISEKQHRRLPAIVEEDLSDSEETYIKISDQEKKDYFKRLELVYKTLDEHLEMPAAKQRPGTSLARGKVMVKVKPSSLPPATFVGEKFDEYLGRAQKAIETVEVKKPKSKESDQKESEQVKVMSQTKPKLGFDKAPFNPSWLYNIEKPGWPDKVKPEQDITLLTYDNELPDDTFSIKRKDLYNIQHATSITMNTSCHIDWMLAALRKLVSEAQRTDIDPVPVLNAIEDLLDGTAYANEFLTEQQIYIHGGITNHMRQTYIHQMEDMTPSEVTELQTQPYNAAAAFNGQIPYIVKNVLQRESNMALRRLARQQANNQNNRNAGRSTRRPRRRPRRRNTNNNNNGLGNFISNNYGTKSSASRGGNRNQYAGFDRHGRSNNQNNQQRNRNQWQNNNYQFQTQGFQNKGKSKRNRNNQQHQQGTRNRDFYYN